MTIETMGLRQDKFLAGSTSQIIQVAMRSSTTGQLLSGVTAPTIDYLRWGAAAKVSVSPQAMSQGSYVSGGWVETDRAGVYQFGVPAGAIVAGARGVDFIFSASGAIDFEYNGVIVGYDSEATTWETESDAATRASTNQTEHDATQTAIGTRLAAADYVEPDNASISAIKAKTDNLPSDPASEALVEAAIATRAPASTALSSAVWTNARAALLDALALLDVAVSTRSTLTADDAADAVWDEALAGHLAAGSTGEALSDAATGAGVDSASIAAAVWAAATRTLTSIASVMDSQGYSAARAALLDRLDASITTRLASVEYSPPDNATIAALQKLLVNKMVVDGVTGRAILYDDDGSTILFQWDLKQADGSIAVPGTDAMRRIPA